ncbi:fibropellin-1-like [Acanthaster planci]|uniref:Delta-like protein n=1 Tax=Acanthaster planci TaxID=133434 RepID=A0A8B7ZXN5_ACAPL|nr:fibropellin-1-like [Acanthaster planci]
MVSGEHYNQQLLTAVELKPRMKLVLILTTLSQIFLLAQSTATVQFKFVSFKNDDHNDLNGGCCDDIIGGCDDFCDNYFLVCIDRDDTGSDGSSCDMARISTERIYEDNDDFNFPSTIPNGIANPHTMSVTSWPGGMQVFAHVWDLDPVGAHDEVDRARRTIDQPAARRSFSAVWQEYTLGQQTEFRFQVKVYCDDHYHGSDCSVQCVPTDDQNGHYRCDPVTGAKICYSGWEGPNCNLDYDECQSNPCVNGVCVNGANRFSCTCTNGWTGTNCDINVDECASMPCKNGGTCHDHVASFSCSCPPGYVYADQFCEYDDCASQPCQNGATCNDLIGHFQCVCLQGYFGDLCEVDIDYCINQTCANNGTCVDQLDGFHCLCEEGFEGVMCEVETDECTSNPCLHNGTCIDLIGKYQCTCEEGYEGTDCEQETDECLSFPCKNNATCEDELAGYHCHCSAGFEGDACENDMDECASFPCHANETCVDDINGFWCQRMNLCDSDPCLNNATCVNDYPGFICECTAGYDGKTCDDDINECASSPCLRGTCVDRLNGFSCLCPPGYSGYTCKSETDECNSSPCVNGLCWDLINSYVCNCTAGFKGVLCEDETDECSSSPCTYGTCVDDLNAYRCECDEFHTGRNCDAAIDDPCALTPCKNGKCETIDSAIDNNYNCICYNDFYGKNCDVDLKQHGAVVFVTGTLDSESEFASRLASLLQKLYSLRLWNTRNDERETMSVEVVRTEDYVKSVDSSLLTRVTFIAWTESGHLLDKVTIEGLIKGASPELIGEFGFDIYYGSAEPYTGKTWIGSNWYIFVVVLAVISFFAVGLLAYRRGYVVQIKDAFSERVRDRGQSALDPLDVAYSTRIFSEFPSSMHHQVNTVESINPAYISCSDEKDHAFMSGSSDEFLGATGGAHESTDNIYAEIPALKCEAAAKENPYSDVKT